MNNVKGNIFQRILYAVAYCRYFSAIFIFCSPKCLILSVLCFLNLLLLFRFQMALFRLGIFLFFCCVWLNWSRSATWLKQYTWKNHITTEYNRIKSIRWTINSRSAMTTKKSWFLLFLQHSRMALILLLRPFGIVRLVYNTHWKCFLLFSSSSTSCLPC